MSEFKKFLIIQAAISAVINMILNAGIGILLFRGIDFVPLWGNPGIALDTLAVAFLLPWLTVLIVAPFARIEMKKGRVGKFQEELRSIRRSYLKLMPDGLLSQSLIIGMGTVIIFTPLMLGLLISMGITELSYRSFIIYKTVFATLLSFPVSPTTWMSAMKKYIRD